MGSQTSLRRTGDSAPTAICHLAYVPWLLSLNFLFAHGGGSTESMFPKEFCVVDRVWQGASAVQIPCPTSEMLVRLVGTDGGGSVASAEPDAGGVLGPTLTKPRRAGVRLDFNSHPTHAPGEADGRSHRY